MRSISLMAATSVILATATACGGGGTDVSTLTASFSQQCTDLACTFTDASTPVGGISSWAWDFGDPTSGATNNVSNLPSPSHTFSAPGTYSVKLTVTDASNASDIQTNPVTVTAGANQPPTASFSVPSCGVGVDCAFHSTSTDAEDGTIAATATHWEFGDPTSPNNTADGVDVTHRYATAGSYTVTLSVTDAAGAPGTTTQTVTVLPTAAENCSGGPVTVTCTLDITSKSTVKITLTSRSCELSGNRVSVTQPTRQTPFANICNRPAPAEYTVIDVTGATATFQAGSQLPIVFTQGTPGTNDPIPGSAVARVEGTFPNWTITIDDGGAPNLPNEPDFNDVILDVQATVVP